VRVWDFSRYMAWSAVALLLAVPAAEAERTPTPPKLDLTYRNDQPVYPNGAIGRMEHGDTVLNVDVDDDGRATKVTVAVSSGFADLDQTAAASAQRYRYVAATDGRHDIAGSMMLTVRFQLSALPNPAIRETDIFALRNEGDRINCRRPPPAIGSLISPPSVCHTQREWEELARRPSNENPIRRPQTLQPGNP
jgi:TonB family protein